MNSPTRIKLIFNPMAGVKKNPSRLRRIIASELSKANCQYDFAETESRGHATEMAAKAVEEGYNLVAAIGGDGTVNEVASGLVGTETALGIIPVGSGNGLARSLGIPMGVRGACRSLVTGEAHRIDVGRLNDRYFFVVSGAGYDAAVGHRFDRSSMRGPWRYFVAGAREFMSYQPQHVCLRFNGHQLTIDAFVLTVANTRQYGNGAIIAPQARPDDGQLDVCVVSDVNFIQMLIHLPKLFTGKIDRSRHYMGFQVSTLEVLRDTPGPVHVDGEPLEGSRCLSYKVLPRALKVMVPPGKRPATP